MKKEYLIGGILTAAIILIAIIFSQSENTKNNGNSSDNSSVAATWEDLMAGKLNESLKCETNYNMGNSSLHLISYYAGQKMRMDYDLSGEMAEATGQHNLHMISDGDYVYIWGDSFLGQQFDGMKYKIEKDENGEIEIPEDAGAGFVNPDDLPDFSCTAWVPDNSKFNIPEDMEFANLDDLTSVMMGGGINDEYDDGGINTDCSACDSLSGEVKKSCLQALGCSDEE